MTEGNALDGVVVLDLTRVLAGPLCAQMLADMGAEVIKVEHPGRGDDTRHWGPPFADTEAAYFLGVNRNKKSLALDFKSPSGLKVLKNLVKKSDIVIDNFKPGLLDKLGLTGRWFEQEASSVIRCSITGYGTKGPNGGMPGYDFLLQAESGLMAITGESDGAPMKLGVAVVDIATGMNAVIGILAALNKRYRTKTGSVIDVNLYNTGIFLLANVASNYLISGAEAKRYGNGHPNIVPYNLFKCGEGSLVISVGNDGQFKQFSESVGHIEWITDARFAKNANRVENRNQIEQLIEEALSSNSADYWYNVLKDSGIPVAVVRTVSQSLSHPQTLENGMVVEIQHSTAGLIKSLGLPIKIDNVRGRKNNMPPPLLGEHNNEILKGFLGMTKAEINELNKREP
ncbi:MAG: formyl-CoA transferase [Alphaproteobacteria bacterium]|nr:formyl-CoA transferase [Alphaproteobacteria bacterium]|tara:strand:+ start:205 stop:1401 length:1197 start_codon:yes stop_codon:yes gene_type:complete